LSLAPISAQPFAMALAEARIIAQQGHGFQRQGRSC